MEHQVVGIADPSSVGVTELLGGKSTYLVTRNEAFCEKCCSRRKQRSFFFVFCFCFQCYGSVFRVYCLGACQVVLVVKNPLANAGN